MDAITRARRLCRWVLVSFLVLVWFMLALLVVSEIAQGKAQWWRLGPALVAVVVFSRYYLRILDAALESRYATREVVVSGALAVFAAVIGGGDPIGWGMVTMAWLSVATVGVPLWRAVWISVGTFVVAVGIGVAGVLTGYSLMIDGRDEPEVPIVFLVLIYTIMCASFPPSNRLWVWIYRLALQAHEGREAHARLAVAEERLRFARDLHDLVGHQLSAIAVKTELAVRLSDANTPAAKAEMAEVNALTRKALRELRQAVRGYRELDLPAELESVRSVLEAAGVRCELRLPHRDLPGEVRPVFAYAVREAVTNVLKHSSATFCDITLRFTTEVAELLVRNDGVVRRQAADLGSGLSGLGERLAAIGGELSAQPTGDGHFALHAVVSLPIRG
ncbi:sensor histidine kinase [Nonomuraea muscovyensis]|uniref:Two-component system sensor histidine kinase DesK n=1 Tax=Nonomuraea muscovyensis TaxID=1124761 RepID=A0A7X0CD80_9ACTN|nr:histidine kinase [Nonomuraea muscovyensis]MBB6351149.1 two-component system sensor histidine kinase DesK [Nonomuraea muscovyensis]